MKNKIKIKELAFREEIETDGFEIIKLNYFFNEKFHFKIEKPHKINFHIFLFITEGEGEHSIDFRTYNYSKGSIIFVQKNQVHAWMQTKNVDGFLVLFTKEYLYNNQVKFHDISYTYPYNSSLYEPIMHLENQNYASFNSLIHSLFQEYYLPDSPSKQAILQNLLRTILLKVRSYPSKENASIDWDKKDLFIRFQKALEEKIAVTRNAKDYCELLYVSYRKLNLTCKVLTNKTIKEFIDDTLVLKAKKGLLKNENNISQVSYSVGFSEITNFTKFFKKHTGLTPKQFKESII